MSDTHNHKIEGKFNQGVISEVPENIRSKWRRHNDDVAEFKQLKLELYEKIIDREVKEELKNEERYNR